LRPSRLFSPCLREVYPAARILKFSYCRAPQDKPGPGREGRARQLSGFLKSLFFWTGNSHSQNVVSGHDCLGLSLLCGYKTYLAIAM
jgi:hypothetical protein